MSDAIAATLAQAATTGGDPGTIRSLWQLNGVLAGRFEWFLVATVAATAAFMVWTLGASVALWQAAPAKAGAPQAAATSV